jgi:hypothetical protein
VKENKIALWFQFLWRITSCHMVTYVILGLVASSLLDYKNIWKNTVLASFMRPFDSPWVPAGLSLQPIRGLLFAVIL